jgi:hypothetical protein
MDFIREISNLYGKSIDSYGDITRIQEDIMLVCGEHISASTLRRVFKLVDYNGKHSNVIVGILENYIQRKRDFTSSKTGSLKRFVIEFLKEGIVTNDLNNKQVIAVFLSLYRSHGSELHHDLSLNDLIAKDYLGRRVYFDQLVCLDGLNHGYGHALKTYIKNEDNIENICFASSLLSLKAYLNKTKQATEYDPNISNEFSYSLHPFVQGRLRVLQILLSPSIKDWKIHEQFIEDTSKHVPLRGNYKLFPCYELVLVESLILMNRKDLVQKILGEVWYKWGDHWRKDQHIDAGYYNFFETLFERFNIQCNDKVNAIPKFPIYSARHYKSISNL